MTSQYRRDYTAGLFTAVLCLVFLAICGAVWFGVTHEWGPSEAELVSDGWPYCEEWEGSLGIDEDAQCIYEGELVAYYDTHYGATLKRARDYAELMN